MHQSRNPSLYINTDSLGISFVEESILSKHAIVSPLETNNNKNHLHNPFPSPSSTSNKSTLWRSQCQLTRHSSNKITPKSWESLKSPAASFLASFSSPIANHHLEEQEGDEIDDYVLDKIIGYGGFSVVRKGFRISDGKKVAIKIIKRQEDDLRLEREINLWKSLSHPNIVSLEKVLETDHATFIICDYCENGNLLDYVKQKKRTEDEIRKVFGELCDALGYLHQEARLVHKDLKLENVLLDENNRVKLCDFGLAICQQPLVQLPLSPPLSGDDYAGGSLAYAAPEQIKSVRAISCPLTDIWSLGVILYALISRKLPFQDEYDPRLQQKILLGEYDMPFDISLELQDLIKHCLMLDPHQRFNIQQVLQSSWLNQ
ncbi:hypothetical protein G6F57_008877 [Rhizopus arrhizus]|uniref:Protein kinase domain-containing protein n=1 Tax=Rhizopus oryzae TaxID=64495 RepID=A0A9P6X4A6_RHIOR|nr:hypothetical protein G6F23_008839 [Rhizopus arrhizus]KAG1405163.1 hypothetical protein G6F58_010063 [Rhizopus delemar]KAG0759328.1 hypothetical protein G6F24_009145 [Rhizopus arrhizus]KAG0785518.1 hypothetical protein G6F21_009205 [Rhizopus arrhizus]KAG0808272.1 hypothetical protein G6F20_009712 [Rhizopus arrhizus]